MNEFLNRNLKVQSEYEINYEDLSELTENVVEKNSGKSDKRKRQQTKSNSLFLDHTVTSQQDTLLLSTHSEVLYDNHHTGKKSKNGFKNSKCFKSLNNFCKSTWSHIVHKKKAKEKIPKMFDFKLPSFYFQNINREQSEVLLSEQDDGVFLIRDSVHYKGQLILSVAYNKSFQHYIIIKDLLNDYVTLDELKWFYSVIDLIKFYQLNQDGLVTKLTVGLSSEFMPNKFYDNIDMSKAIQLNEIEFKEHIGSGEFGIVRRGFWNSKEVAIKQIKDLSLIESFLNEVNIMSNLNHKNVIKLYGISIECTLLLLTDYMSKGSLLNYLQSRGRTVIGINELVKYAYEISCGLTYLEKNKISHNDLCASNILLNEANTAKICDFGLAKHYRHLNKTKISKIRIRWTAPEVLTKKYFNFKSDIWSFGVLLYELFSYGRIPYPNIKLDAVHDYVKSGQHMSVPEDCPNNIYNIMCTCWSLKTKSRPKFEYIEKMLYNLNQNSNMS